VRASAGRRPTARKASSGPTGFESAKQQADSVQVILAGKEIEALLGKLAQEMASRLRNEGEAALVGIRSRGEILAQRLQSILREKHGLELERGTLDITLYRDDLNQRNYHDQPKVQATEIDFDISGRLIVLVDDVLNTGRSARAAMDALMDLGRPRTVAKKWWWNETGARSLESEVRIKTGITENQQ
jgi:pyrimidine operon attenuation protein/uracil phosphoribosyltransferase